MIIHNLQIIQADCMAAMKDYPDNYFDLAIVDPPYGIGMSGGKIGGDNAGISKNYKHFSGNDLSAPSKDYFEELARVSRNQIIFGANHFIENIPSANSSCWLVWDKDNTGNFADAELAYTSFGSAVRVFQYRWNGMLQGDMKNKEHRIHPTQKPVKLYDWIYANYAEKGQKILDTHLGSGSNAIAAHYAGMGEFVGIELDEDYYAAACERITEQTRQQVLF